LSRLAKLLGLGVVEVDFVFFNLFARSSFSSLEEEEDEEELEEDEELLLFSMLSSSTCFTDLLKTLESAWRALQRWSQRKSFQ
jgi:hypothetical protein